jgi:hypothetical protein
MTVGEKSTLKMNRPGFCRRPMTAFGRKQSVARSHTDQKTVHCPWTVDG